MPSKIFVSLSCLMLIILSVFAVKHNRKVDKVRFYANFIETKTFIVQQQIDEAEKGYVLLAGDSNAELYGSSERVCGAAIVNAGVSGSSTKQYDQFFRKLNFNTAPKVAVLTIGTNDLYWEKTPRSEDSLREFDSKMTDLIGQLKSLASDVIVTDLPPMGREVEKALDVSAVDEYSRHIHLICAKMGCRSIDPFAPLRDGASGFGIPGANRDGKHLAHYKPVLTTIANGICPN